MSLLELLDPVEPAVPRLLLPEGSVDFAPDEDDPVPLDPLVCAQLCGAITNTAPLRTRLDNTVVWVFFISASFLLFKISNKLRQWSKAYTTTRMLRMR